MAATTPARDNQANRQEQRREEIREVSLSLFAEYGYHGTSMSDIARGLGIKAASLYNHVDSKQALLWDITSQTMRTLIEDHRSVIETSTDPTTRLQRAMEAHVRYHATHPRETRIGNTEITSLEEPRHEELIAMRRSYSDAWEELIQDGVDQGVFQTRSVRMAAFAMLEMGIGVALWYQPEGELTVSEVAHIYGDLTLRLVT